MILVKSISAHCSRTMSFEAKYRPEVCHICSSQRTRCCKGNCSRVLLLKSPAIRINRGTVSDGKLRYRLRFKNINSIERNFIFNHRAPITLTGMYAGRIRYPVTDKPVNLRCDMTKFWIRGKKRTLVRSAIDEFYISALPRSIKLATE